MEKAECREGNADKQKCSHIDGNVFEAQAPYYGLSQNKRNFEYQDVHIFFMGKSKMSCRKHSKTRLFSPHNGRGSPKGYCCSVLDLAKTPAASQDLLPAWHTATIALNAPMVSCLRCRCVAWLAILLAGKSCKSGKFFVLGAPRWHGPSSFCVSAQLLQPLANLPWALT